MFLTGTHLSEQCDAVIRWPLECVTERSIANQKGIAQVIRESESGVLYGVRAMHRANTMSGEQDKSLPSNPRSIFVIGITS